MIKYCPHCWATVAVDARICPCCREALSADENGYAAKLVAALHHPEPFTQRRAAYILGLLRDPTTVEALAEVLRSAADPYVKGEAAHALGAIGGARARAILQQVVQDETQASMVRRTAAQALEGESLDPGEIANV